MTDPGEGGDMEDKKNAKVSFGRTIRNQFMAGLLVTIPLAATILILVWLFNAVDNILKPAIEAIFKRDLPGVGFGVTIILIYIAGVITRNVIGHRVLKWGNDLLDRVPIFRLVYKSIRQIMNSFTVPDTTFMQVVLVEFPNKGQKAIAFITNEMTDKEGHKLFSVLIPTAPNPTTGFLEIFHEKDIIRTNIPVDEAIKMIVSAGKVMPEEVREKIRANIHQL
jgi:uncharacterized membrane protein